MFCEVFSLCYVRFLVCVMCLCTLASLRSLRPLHGRCGRFVAAAAASRPRAITPNIIVFVVRGLTFVNVSALDTKCTGKALLHAQAGTDHVCADVAKHVI